MNPSFLVNIRVCSAVLASAAILSSCGGGREGEAFKSAPAVYEISVNPDKLSDVSLFDYFDTARVVSLDTAREAFFVGDMHFNHYVASPDDLFVLDSRMGRILDFSWSGKLKRVYARRGKGPGEFVDVCDMLLNRYTHQLELLTPQGHVLRYNVDDSLSFRESIRIGVPSAVSNFAVLSKGVYVLYSSVSDPNLFLYREEGDQLMPIDYHLPKWFALSVYVASASPFFYFGEEVRYYEKFDGSVYKLDTLERALIPYLRLRTGRYQFTEKSLPPDKDADYYARQLHRLSGRSATPFYDMSETERYFFSHFRLRNQLFTVVVDKRDSTCDVFTRTRENMLLGAAPVVPGERFVDFFSPEEKEAINSRIFSVEDAAAFEALSVESNWSLILYHLR